MSALPILQIILRKLAVWKLSREHPRIIAITGSVGKTTTKEAVFAVLSRRFGSLVRRSAGNLNNEQGVPLAILGFDFVPTRWQYPFVLLQALIMNLLSIRSSDEQWLVLEIAAEKPGDISYLTGFLRPYLSIGVVTNVGPIHLDPGQFTSIESIGREKGLLIEALPPDGFAILNKNNPLTKRMATSTRAKVVWFADRGVGSAQEIAKLVGKIFKMKKQVIEEALASFTPPYGRFHEFPALKGATIIDDTYNANPMSMEQALLALGNRPGRKIAVLGDMLELGGRERVYHEQVGMLAKKMSEVIVTVGKRARWYQGTYHFATPLEAAHFLKKFIHPGDTILIKGSQSMRMELISEVLLANPADAAQLPRQTPTWKSKSFVQP